MEENFEDFLKKNMSAWDFEHLAEHLGESEKKTTLLIRTPKDLSGEHISVLSQLLAKWNADFNAQYLIENFVAQPLKQI